MDALIHPTGHSADVTPHDTNDIAETRGLFVGTAGDVKVIMASGVIQTWPNLAAGIIHAIRCTRVFNTDTTAGDIIAVY